MLLVTQGKGRINQLGYNKRTHEYVYFHKGVEIWREKGNEELLDYFNEIRASFSSIDGEIVSKYLIWKKYEESCESYERIENR